MEPSEIIRDARRLPIILCRWAGVDPFNKKVHPQFIIAFLVACNYTVMFINGCYHSLDDPYKFIHAFAPIAITITLSARVFTLFYRNWIEFDPPMIAQVYNLYENNENDPRYTKILAKRASETDYYMKLLTLSTFSFFHLPIVTTIIPYVLNGQKVLFLNNFLPYTDPTETFDFFLNVCLQTLMLPMVFSGIIFSDLLFVMYGYHSVAMCDMMCCHLDELAKDLIKLHDERVKMVDNNKGTIYQVMMREMRTKQAQDEKLKILERRFIAIMHEHKVYEKFLNDLFYYTEIPLIAQMWCNSISIGMCIVVFFKLSVLLGIAGGLIFSSIVLTPCIIGTFISHQNERFADYLLDFPYFDMSKSKQKVFLQFIHAVQNTPEFTLPIFGTVINLEAFTDVLNVSYSYFTFFWTMAGN